MPITTPDIKVDAVRRLGGTVELVGETYSETQTYAQVSAQAVCLPGIRCEAHLPQPMFDAQVVLMYVSQRYAGYHKEGPERKASTCRVPPMLPVSVSI